MTNKKINPKLSQSCNEQLLALRDSIELLGGKWKLLILLYLFNNKKVANHFKKIQREIMGISAKMLTKELRDLETNFLIQRTVQIDPHMVFYKLSEYGNSAINITLSMMRWGIKHREKVKKNF